MILLGVDYGLARVGLATMDTSTGFAFPLRTIAGGDVGVVVRGILEVAAAEGAERVVIGMPMPLDSSQESETMQSVIAFVEVLRALTALPVVTQNEQMTSAQVEKQWKAMGMKKGQVDVDAAAAALILESYWARQGK